MGKKKSVKGKNSAKIDCAEVVRVALQAARQVVYEHQLTETGLLEAKLLGQDPEDLPEQQEEITETEIDKVFDESDKNGKTVRTIDNFTVYDAEGEPADLAMLLVEPGIGDDWVLYGTVVEPLKWNDEPLVRVARSTPRDGDLQRAVEMLEKHIPNKAKAQAGKTGSKAIKVPEYNPNITRAAAYRDAVSLCESNPTPFIIGGMTVTDLGEILRDTAYHTRTHVFPAGFRSERQYASAIDPNDKAMYTSEVVQGDSGPIFRVCHEGGEPSWEGPSSSNVWQSVLNAVNDRRLEMGMPKGGESISGPEMFGFANSKVASLIEGLPGVEECETYVFRAMRPSARSPVRADTGDSTSALGSSRSRRRTSASTTLSRKPKTTTKKEEAALRRATPQLVDFQEKELAGIKGVLKKLQGLSVDADSLTQTGLGKLVNRLRKHPEKKIASTAKELKNEWKVVIENSHGGSATKKDIAVAIDCCIKLGSWIGFGTNGVTEMVQEKIDKRAESTPSSPLSRLVQTLERVNRVRFVNRDTLLSTGTGKPISKLCKHLSQEVADLALKIKTRWENQIAGIDEGEAEDDIGKGAGADEDNEDMMDEEVVQLDPAPDEEKRGDEMLNDDEDEVDQVNSSEAMEIVKGQVEEVDTETAGKKEAISSSSSTKATIEGEEQDIDTNGKKKSSKKKGKFDPEAYDAIPRRRSMRAEKLNKLKESTADETDYGEQSNSLKRKRDEVEEEVEQIIKKQKMEPLGYTVPDKQFSVLKKVKAEKLAVQLSVRRRIRVRIEGIKAVTMTHGEYDPILWIETENARYRIAGRNVPVAPAENYYSFFLPLWKRFEACWRFVELLENCDEELTFEAALNVVVQDGTECPRRIESPRVESKDCLTKADVIENALFILDQVPRVHKNQKKVEKIFQSKIIGGLLARGGKEIPEELKDFIRKGKADPQKAQKLREKDLQKKEQLYRRMVEEGFGLPDDLDVAEEDFARAKSGAEPSNPFMQELISKHGKILRPVPTFLPCDFAFVDFDRLCACVRTGHSEDVDFKDMKVGTFGFLSAGSFSLEGIRFANMLSIWSTLKFVGEEVLDKKTCDFTQPDIANFARFRLAFAKSQFDNICVALLQFLVSESGKGEPESSSGTGTSKGTIVGVEDPSGISTRRSRRNRSTVPVYSELDASVHLPSYPYNADELWPVPDDCINLISWPEVARRSLVHRLQMEDEKRDEEEDEEDEQPITKRKRSALKKAIKIEPDLLSTCDEILADLMDDPAAPPFAVPVNPVLHNAPNYFEVIKRPMDMETIQRRLRAGHYDIEKAPPTNRYSQVIEWIAQPQAEDGDGEGDENEERDSADGEDGEGQVKMDIDLKTESDTQQRAFRNECEYQIALDDRFYEHDSLGGGHEGFAADIRQIWRNCRLFNKSHTKIYNDCRKLEGQFKTMYEQKIRLRDPKYLYDDDVKPAEEQQPDTVKMEVDEESNGTETSQRNDSKDGGDLSSRAPVKVETDTTKATASAETLPNSLNHIEPYQPGLPSLEEVILQLNNLEDFSLLPFESKQRMMLSLLDMALDTASMRFKIQKRVDNQLYHHKIFQKELKDDQKKERDLFGKPEELAAHRTEMEQRRADFEKKLSNDSIRLEPLGVDRFFNKYWILEEEANIPFLYVEMSRTGQWGVFTTKSDIEALIESLDPRGGRENALQRTLKLKLPLIESSIAKARELAQSKIKEYVDVQNGDDQGRVQEIEAAQKRLADAESVLATVSEDAKKYSTAQTDDGKVYFYHRETRATSWEKPTAILREEEEKANVERMKHLLDLSKAAPEEAVEKLKCELLDDVIVLEAFERCKGEEVVKEEEILREERSMVHRCSRFGYSYRALDLLASLMALEFLTAGPSASNEITARGTSWYAGDDSDRSKWLHQMETILSMLNLGKPWAGVREILQKMMVELYNLFDGNVYELTSERAQRAVVTAIKHKYRWTRAVERSKNLSELGLMFGQLVRILQLTRADERALQKQKEVVTHSLRESLSLDHQEGP